MKRRNDLHSIWLGFGGHARHGGEVKRRNDLHSICFPSTPSHTCDHPVLHGLNAPISRVGEPEQRSHEPIPCPHLHIRAGVG